MNQSRMVWRAQVCASDRKGRSQTVELEWLDQAYGAVASDACSKASEIVKALRYQQASWMTCQKKGERTI